MSFPIKQYKIVAALPVELEPNAIYYVKINTGFDLYVTNLDGTEATPLNAQLSDESFIAVINEEPVGVPKGSPVFTTGTGYRLAIANNPNCKKVIGLTAFDTLPGQLGLVQKNGSLIFNNTEWSIVSGNLGGVTSSNFWLDAVTPGKLSSSSPSESINPAWALKVGCGLNSTTFSIQIQATVKL
jgi:hypothetical protein